MKTVLKLVLFLLLFSCQKDSEKEDAFEVEVNLPSPATEPVLEKPLELVWSDEFDGPELNL